MYKYIPGTKTTLFLPYSAGNNQIKFWGKKKEVLKSPYTGNNQINSWENKQQPSVLNLCFRYMSQLFQDQRW